MSDADVLETLRCELQKELTENLLPYWMEHTVDEDHGGFVGRVDHHGAIVDQADKGAVLNARILWTFASAFRLLGDQTYFHIANRANTYLNAHFWDTKHKGVFWTLDYLGRPKETTKKIYAQSFAIYGLAEFHRATGHVEALYRATQLFRLIETHGFDTQHGGYFEAFNRSWGPLNDVRLSDKDLNAPKSMNTHLHVLEAYTNLYRIWPNVHLHERLLVLVRLFLETIIDPDTHHLRLFFDTDWSVQSRIISFGHDIEATWLLMEAAEVLNNSALRDDVRDITMKTARVTLENGLDRDGGLFYERDEHGHLDTDKHWWPQAEAIVGFLNAYQVTGERVFLDATQAAWSFIKQHIIDHAAGEWFGRVARDGQPFTDEDKVGLWKCPYHNARTCFEVLERIETIDECTS